MPVKVNYRGFFNKIINLFCRKILIPWVLKVAISCDCVYRILDTIAPYEITKNAHFKSSHDRRY